MRKIIFGLMALMFAFTACGVSVSAGTVTDKQFEEAYTTEEEIEECEWDTDTKTTYVNGKAKKTTTREHECAGTGEFETIEHPAVYELTLEDKQGNDETHEVTQEEYESVEIGDFFDTEAQ